MKAILGLGDIVTNVNIPNYGQIPNLPIGAVVETNARFTSDSVTPVFSGEIPQNILGLVNRTVVNQELVADADYTKNLEPTFTVFINDGLNYLCIEDSKKLFNTMIEKTSDYLKMYYRRFM